MKREMPIAECCFICIGCGCELKKRPRRGRRPKRCDSCRRMARKRRYVPTQRGMCQICGGSTTRGNKVGICSRTKKCRSEKSIRRWRALSPEGRQRWNQRSSESRKRRLKIDAGYRDKLNLVKSFSMKVKIRARGGVPHALAKGVMSPTWNGGRECHCEVCGDSIGWRPPSWVPKRLLCKTCREQLKPRKNIAAPKFCRGCGRQISVRSLSGFCMKNPDCNARRNADPLVIASRRQYRDVMPRKLLTQEERRQRKREERKRYRLRHPDKWREHRRRHERRRQERKRHAGQQEFQRAPSQS
jgi:hypothetical protein